MGDKRAAGMTEVLSLGITPKRSGGGGGTASWLDLRNLLWNCWRPC